ncbi:hypothetical protein B488_05040 [Liberibacter crescens BT-1]|uniref:DUF5681 domain-containing protein n=1 Tax=Liberibacter crescens (strain BT-1) TaxID=1215343 RepID=L0EVU5_LIBCB|nr:DUF5681 domain-containing protein [Liberibacter crescens]AGA64496.1 hypothetical protein B488_05040 [Liberibacter crescens BT-1]
MGGFFIVMAMEEKNRDTRFKPGESGNPKGRTKGSRNKICDDFINALCCDFETEGIQVIARVREEAPGLYMKIVASLLPSVTKVSGDEEGSPVSLNVTVRFVD